MARVQIAAATLPGNSLRQTVHTHCASVHQASKLVAALLRVGGGNCGTGGKYWQPTVGFMTHVTCRLTAKYRDQLRNSTLGNRVRATFTFLCLLSPTLRRCLFAPAPPQPRDRATPPCTCAQTSDAARRKRASRRQNHARLQSCLVSFQSCLLQSEA